MKNIEICTVNEECQNGEHISGYYEIHRISYLQNKDHLIATIDSIIKNNLLYGCDDTDLKFVTVACDDMELIDEINKHYNGSCGKIKIYADYLCH